VGALDHDEIIQLLKEEMSHWGLKVASQGSYLIQVVSLILFWEEI